MALLPLGRQLAAALWWTSLVLLVGLALVFAARRLAGGLTEPLAGGLIVVLALGLAAACVLLRQSVLGTTYSVPGTAVHVVPGIAAAIILAALTLPGMSAWAVAMSWFVLAAAECLTWIAWHGQRRRQVRQAPRTIANDDAPDEEVPAALIQSLARERTAEGGEALHALVRATCEAGDRIAVVHLAFCPPLAATPELTTHVLDESGAEARITLAQAYGARIEVRLPRPAILGQTVLLEVLGSVTAT